jgi:2-polyprenyl-3-methyl-5-hydroxy-6-metoxy-1,4-benzoquinol methylase
VRRVSAIEFLQRRCPICDGADARPVLKKGDLQLVRCVGCAMIFANPVPREFETGDFYDHSGAYYLSEDKLRSDYSPVRFERELRIFTRHVPGGQVLDVGCSTGAFLHQLQTRFPARYTVTGTDVAGPALDYAQSQGIAVRRGNFLEQPFDPVFDAVTFWAVVEHLVHPRPFLEKAGSLLKRGGYCFVLVPNFKSLATKILGANYRYILPQHVNYFTAETLRALCSQYFRVERITTTHFNPMVIWSDLRAKKEAAERDRAALLKKTTAMKQSRALYPVRLLYKAAEAVLAGGMLADNLVAILRKK